MAATLAPEQQADSADAVLAAVREARAAADREEVRILELAHRLPRVWARVKADELPPWRARRIAGRTVAYLRTELRTSTGTSPASRTRSASPSWTGWPRKRWCGSTPRPRRSNGSRAADGRHVTIYTGQVGFDGTVHLQGELDLADALDLDAALSDGAARLAELGWQDSLDVRRAHALDELARGADPTLPLPGREVVLNVHVSDRAISDEDGTPLARVENTRSFVSVDQVCTWCGTRGTRRQDWIDYDDDVASRR